jgi:putative endonuclease
VQTGTVVSIPVIYVTRPLVYDSSGIIYLFLANCDMACHNELGKLGEELAVASLIHKGYEILERNFVFEKAEIDIIAKKDETLVIVEVKTRNSWVFGDPQSFVSKGKIKLLVKAANEYVLQNDLDMEVRFDIIAVLKNKYTEHLEHFENAFYHF